MAPFLKLTFNIIIASSCVEPSASYCISLSRDLHYTGTIQSNKATHLIKYHCSQLVYRENCLLTSHSHCKQKERAPGFPNSQVSSLTAGLYYLLFSETSSTETKHASDTHEDNKFPLISISTLRMIKSYISVSYLDTVLMKGLVFRQLINIF